MFNNKPIPAYMMAYYNKKQQQDAINIPIVNNISKKELKEQKFEQAIDKIKNSEDVKKKPPTEKELSIDDYIELLKEDGNRKYYIQLLESLKE